MTSLRQIESNRRNAQKSTGPKTESGKQRASQNAVRHGLTAETVIKLLEDPDDYRAFEMSVTADYDPETAVERELVLRLASLLWRLRRATSIETGLLQVEYQIPPEQDPSSQPGSTEDRGVIAIFPTAAATRPSDACSEADRGSVTSGGRIPSSESLLAVREPDGLELALRFLRLADSDKGAFELLGRYEAALWRQVRQTIFTIEALRWRRPPHARSWRTQDRWQRAAASSSDAL
jgi:hypothetical protein